MGWKMAVVKTYPLFKTVVQVVLCTQDVSSLHDSQEGWKRAPLLERRGEPADIRGTGCAATSALSWRN